MKVLIITGGNIDIPFALDFLKKNEFEQIVVVDGGLDKVKEMQSLGEKIKINHIVGDFDTVNHEVLSEYEKDASIIVHEYQPEKDYTDTDIALKLGIKLAGAGGHIVILGATGTRLDHVLANLQMLRLPLEAGIDCRIVDKHNQIRMIKGYVCLNEKISKYISLIPISSELEEVTLRGFKYPLENHSVHLGESLCVSNEIVALPAEINIKEGYALLIESQD